MPSVETPPFSCPSCCGDRRCFQQWTATWSCADAAWTLTPGAFACKPADTSVEWAGANCNWAIWVDTGEGCSGDDDCAGHPDTDTPDDPPNHDGCCKCFQQWSASWDCFTEMWTLTPGDFACKPADTATGWVRVSACGHERWVGTGDDCETAADCGGDDTAEPAPPDDHDGCCNCSTCALTPEELFSCLGAETSCDGDVPSSVELTIAAAEGADNCQYDGAAPFHVWAVHCASLPGTSYHLDWNPEQCRWEGTFDILGQVTVDYCVGDGSGCVCEPDTDTLVQAILTITLGDGGVVNFQLDVEASDAGLPTGLGGLPVTVNVLHATSDFVRCCDPFTIVGDHTAPGDDWNQVLITEVQVVPC